MTLARTLALAFLLGCGGGGGGGGTTPPPATPTSIPVSPEIRAAIDAPDREADDKVLDAGRRPDQILSFFGVAPKMNVAEIGAGGGYTSELLARVVGPSGKVYAENPQDMMDKFFGKEWNARVAKPVNANIVSWIHPTDDPLPPEAKDLDVVLIHLLYHDLYWIGTDRAKMNGAILKALKAGGVYGIVDHSGRPGTGTTEVQTIHRIEEKAVIADVQAAGFKLAGEAEFLRHPEDTREWSTAPFPGNKNRGKSDRFVLKFVKP
jgi:predicted methyltransferase